IYTKYTMFLIGSGRWRDVEINIRFSMNLIRKITNKDEIKRFLIYLAYYHYIIKDPEGYLSYTNNILRAHPYLESSSSYKLALEQIELLFSMYSRENSEKIIEQIPYASSRFVKMLMVMKYFNNSLNNYDNESIAKIAKYISELKHAFIDIPYISDYFFAMECLLNEDYINSLKTTIKLGKENYAKGYIFDSYFAILSSYFFFKNKSLFRNSEFFEDKLNLLSSKLVANMPFEKRESFQNKYWVI
ncbi:MAG: hypothetical protein KKD38_08840, partial [Candidatus Delongbacteria bacterium]|nr:hypothetical protein [Candidatus Delongbacteria bacterium]MCG2760053.1 hypothetical protein [Candidatus Delongbacteria bacterium]